MKEFFVCGLIAWSLSIGVAAGLPSADLDFLRDLTRDVIQSSTVQPGSNGGGRWTLTNGCGFPLITPGKDTYTAFWIRDFSMAADSGLISTADLLNHLELICRCQNGSNEVQLANGLHLPPWAIPDHINYNGLASFYPGTYSSGQDQGNGAFGRIPPADDHYEFVHIAYCYWELTRDKQALQGQMNGVTLFDRLWRAFASPLIDPATGLVETTEADRAVGFGFCDAEVHTGKLLFASLLRYRAAGELTQMAKAIGRSDLIPDLQDTRKRIPRGIRACFRDPAAVAGWLRASTGISRQPDVWGTLFALHLGVLNRADASLARKTVVDAIQSGTIVFDGAVRHVPTNLDFSATTAWERSIASLGTYQNGGYWHTASGWLIEAVWRSNPELARGIWEAMIRHLQQQDYRKGAGLGAPWEVIGPENRGRQNPVYLASVALPYSIVKGLR